MNLIESISQFTSFVPEDTSLGDIAFLLADSSVGVVGITRDGQPVGTISDVDIAIRAEGLGFALSDLRATEVIGQRPVLVEWQSDDSDLIDAAILMRRNESRHAVVMRDGAPFAVLSFAALARNNVGN